VGADTEKFPALFLPRSNDVFLPTQKKFLFSKQSGHSETQSHTLAAAAAAHVVRGNIPQR
jgi:hypothetical protein